ncbi:hypothetical protein BYT27DRAFT_7209925 [Phlegmacium glaucopus]|nr:hypothetical protein BYT27DRAFT_7209925 [Phlegmacium glaucopus]
MTYDFGPNPVTLILIDLQVLNVQLEERITALQDKIKELEVQLTAQEPDKTAIHEGNEDVIAEMPVSMGGPLLNLKSVTARELLGGTMMVKSVTMLWTAHTSNTIIGSNFHQWSYIVT